MSSVTSSTSTIVSPYATVNEQIKPGKFEANEKEYGTVGAAVLGVGDAIADGAHAVVDGVETVASDANKVVVGVLEFPFAAVSKAADAVGSLIDKL